MSAFIAVVLLKATVLLMLGCVIAFVARQASASVRHGIWALTLAGAVGLPLGMLATPAWEVSVLPSDMPVATNIVAPRPTHAASITSNVSPIAERSTVISDKTVSSGNPSPGFGERIVESIPMIWALGALSVLLWTLIGWMALQRVARRASPITSAEWKSILEQERLRAGVTTRVTLLTSESVSTPLTWGIRAPVVLLPADATEWNLGHLTVVLRHEIAHIARADTLTQTLGVVACAVYWFNPLVWIAARGMRAEQERACDEQVLISGTPAVEYAAHLLEVARSARTLGPQGLVSLAMARPSQLEGRLLAVLNNSRRRRSTSPVLRRIAIACGGAGFLVLSAFTPISRVSPLPKVAAAASIVASQFVPTKSPVIEKKSDWTEEKSDRSEVTFISEKRDSTFTKSVSASEGGTLDLDLDTGAGLTITVWDRPLIEVSGRLAGRNWRDTEVNLYATSSGARLTSRLHTRDGNTSTSHHFDLRLPRRYNIHVQSSGGGINISGLDGNMSGTTGGGEITIRNARGSANITTGGGNIRVSSSNLSGSVSTGGGTVVIDDVRGGLRGSSGSSTAIYANSGRTPTTSIVTGRGRRTGIDIDDEGGITVSGPSSSVTINERTGEVRDASGKVIFRKSGGGINVPDAMNGADVRTGGGDIRIGRAGDDVIATTGGGNITIGPLTGSVRASTGAGDVRIDFNGVRSPSADIQSGAGKVIITLPSDFSGTLDLETAYTENNRGRTTIKSDWPLSLTETRDWDDSRGTPRRYVRARERFGNGGGVISVETVNGDIEVRKR